MARIAVTIAAALQHHDSSLETSRGCFNRLPSLELVHIWSITPKHRDFPCPQAPREGTPQGRSASYKILQSTRAAIIPICTHTPSPSSPTDQRQNRRHDDMDPPRPPAAPNSLACNAELRDRMHKMVDAVCNHDEVWERMERFVALYNRELHRTVYKKEYRLGVNSAVMAMLRRFKAYDRPKPLSRFIVMVTCKTWRLSNTGSSVEQFKSDCFPEPPLRKSGQLEVHDKLKLPSSPLYLDPDALYLAGIPPRLDLLWSFERYVAGVLGPHFPFTPLEPFEWPKGGGYCYMEKADKRPEDDTEDLLARFELLLMMEDKSKDKPKAD
ncbi:hypothetical protein QBC39DRAFT_86480 [Podospora conica]|nr:hypothetical protein QBC39DRAFT_86480 [Schizothecium conicum]